MPFNDIGFIGYWNPMTNDPALVSGKGEAGRAYICSGYGTTVLDGIPVWYEGDLVYFGLDKWHKGTGYLSSISSVSVILSQIIWIGDDPPPLPWNPGRLWYESDSGTMYIWYDDGSSAQWVQVSSFGSQGPAGPQGETGMPGLPGSNPNQILSLFVSGPPPVASEVLFQHKFTLNTTFPAGLSGSQGLAGIAAAASTVFEIAKNGANFGTATFSAAGTIPTFAAASPTIFAVGDVLTVVAPATPDGAIGNISLSLMGAT